MRGLARIVVVAVAVAVATVGLSGCQQLSDTFRCGTASTCGAGTCEPTGYCSFDDTGCASGRRYGAASSGELANTCVGDVVGGADADRFDTIPPIGLDAGPARTSRGLAALYTFAPSSVVGTTVHDVSGFGDPLDLEIPAGVTVVGGDAILDGDPGIRSLAGTKIVTACEISDEATVEAWVTPSTAISSGGTHQITGLMLDFQTRNIALYETAGAYRADLRSDATAGGANGTMSSAAGVLKTSPTHLISTRTASGDRVFYVDGEVVQTINQPGALNPWTSSYRLYVGNNPDDTAAYQGTIHLVAYYCSGLTSEEVKQNFDAGPNAGDE